MFSLIFWSPYRLFWGLGKGQKNVLGSNHVFERLSMFHSILTFDFELILELFLTIVALISFFVVGVG